MLGNKKMIKQEKDIIKKMTDNELVNEYTRAVENFTLKKDINTNNIVKCMYFEIIRRLKRG